MATTNPNPKPRKPLCTCGQPCRCGYVPSCDCLMCRIEDGRANPAPGGAV